MADNLPTNFPIPPESSIVSYSYTNVAEGTGIIKFYGYASADSSGTTYHLGKNAVYSNITDSGDSTLTSSYVKRQDLDFDLSPFNTPQTIGGTATLNICMRASGDHTSVSGKFIALIKKVSGGETTLVTLTSEDPVASGNVGAGDGWKVANIKGTIPNTHFKIGDQLRLTIEVYQKISGAGNGWVAIGLDPQNRDGDYITPSSDDPTSTTKLEFYCPFRINL